jgi:hypothetical protein
MNELAKRAAKVLKSAESANLRQRFFLEGRYYLHQKNWLKNYSQHKL